MRTILLPSALLLATATAFQLPDFQPFFSALPVTLQDYIPAASLPNNQTAQEQQHKDLLKRQATISSIDACPTSFNSCENLGAPNLCCAANAVCSADYGGHVACCPSGVACSGTISGVITAGTVNSDGSLVGVAAATGDSVSSGAAGVTTTDNGLVAASTTTGLTTDTGGLATSTTNGFIIANSETVATPGAGMRAVEVPLLARAILRVLEYLPI